MAGRYQLKILTIVSTYAPHAIGGAEVSAQNSLTWLRDRGHEVAALTMAQDGEPELHGETVDGVRLWRLSWPRHHTHLRHQQAPAVHKLGWHLQDHFDPRNRQLMARVLDEFNPDAALVRVISGIGYNSCYELAKRDIRNRMLHARSQSNLRPVGHVPEWTALSRAVRHLPDRQPYQICRGQQRPTH